MKTYAINHKFGKLASGIPSLEAAKAVAIDFLRYAEDRETGDTLLRHEVTFELTEDEYDPGVLNFIALQDGEHELGIYEESRCDACRQVANLWHGYLGT